MEKLRKNLLLVNSSIYIVLFILTFMFVPTQKGIVNTLFLCFIGMWVVVNFTVFINKEKKGNKEFILKLIFEWVLISPFLSFILLYFSAYYFHFSIKLKPHTIEAWATLITVFSVILFFITLFLILEINNRTKECIKINYDYFRSSLRIKNVRFILFFGFYSIFSIFFKLPIDITSAVSAIFLIILDKDYSKLKNWEVLSKSPGSDKAFKIEKEVFFNKITLLILASSTIIADKVLVLSNTKSESSNTVPFNLEKNINMLNLLIFAALLLISIPLLKYLENSLKKPDDQ